MHYIGYRNLLSLQSGTPFSHRIPFPHNFNARCKHCSRGFLCLYFTLLFVFVLQRHIKSLVEGLRHQQCHLGADCAIQKEVESIYSHGRKKPVQPTEQQQLNSAVRRGKTARTTPPPNSSYHFLYILPENGPGLISHLRIHRNQPQGD